MLSKRARMLFLAPATVLLALLAAAVAPAWHDEFAAALHDAWTSGEPMPQVSGVHPEATLADGYAVQRRFVERQLEGGAIGGFKAAAVGASAQAGLGVDGPITGVVPESGVWYAKDDIAIDLADDPHYMIETEIGYVFGQGISGEIPDTAVLKKHVKGVAAVVEIPGGNTQQATPETAADLAARNVNAKAIVVGPRHEPRSLDPDGVDITLTHNGKTVNTANGGDAAGGQWETLRKTVNTLVSQEYTIESGHVITNGALGEILPAEPGEYVADYGELGTIRVEVTDTRPGE